MMVAMSRWRVAGRCCAALGWLLWVAVQVVADDPFPPQVSVSQYGLGAGGWVFSVWVVVLTSSPLLLMRYRPVPGAAQPMLWIGYAGAWLMALVRTDEGGVQVTVTAHLHMVGAVLTLVFLPLGICCALRPAALRWRIVAIGLLSAGTVVGSLLLLAAAGVDTAGLGTSQSWALWQGVLVVAEMVLVTVYAVAVGTIAPAPVQSSIA
jgi:hypothetical protein